MKCHQGCQSSSFVMVRQAHDRSIIRHKKMLKWLDHLFVIRPVLMPPVWTIVLLGHHRSAALFGESNLPGLVLLLVTFLVGGVYLLNQIYDVDSDRINKKLFFLAEGYISKRKAIFQTVLLNLISIIPAYLISLELGLLFTLGFLFGFFYSAPPFSLKGTPFGGLLCNVLAHGNLAFLMGWSMNGNLSRESIVFSLPYMFAVGAVYLNATVPDMEGDNRSGKTTVAVKWGKDVVVVLSFVLVILAIIGSFLIGDIPFFIASTLVFPFFLFGALTKKKKNIVLSTKLSVLFLSVAAGFFYPWYFVILFLGFLGTRVYYKARFNYDYPTLK
jgi:4-hydroxybenzoate polyprenyltransferase